jgi:hypothetical protein
MKTARISGLVACFLLLGGLAYAQDKTLEQSVVTVRQTMDYTYNNWLGGPWFVEPGWILDHSPFYRLLTEDWGWTHNVTSLVPANATGIQSATLTIIAWNVDDNRPECADHVIIAGGTYEYVNDIGTYRGGGTELGVLSTYYASPTVVNWPDPDNQERLGYEDYWSITSFDLPQNVLDELWANGQIKIWINIDRYRPYGATGYRVTLKSAMLTVKYAASGPAPGAKMPVYRFWSPVLASHFYTMDEVEKQYVIDTYPGIWSYEGIAYLAMSDQTNPRAVPVYRFWSDSLGSHFFTADEVQKNSLLNEYPDVWTFEGTAFYAFPLDGAAPPAGTLPVYRFLSESLGTRFFYTISEAEKDYVIATWPDVWGLPDIAWYAYPPEQQ